MLRLRRTQRDQIAGELRDHLIEHVAHLEAAGISHEEAVRRALEEFGDAAALAAGFSALVGMRRRRLIMRCTIGTTVVMTGLVLAMLAFRPPVIDDPSLAQAQPGPASGQPARKALPGEGTVATPARGQTGRPLDPDAATRAKLKETSDGEFVEMPLHDVLRYFSDKHGIQYYIDKRSLEEANVAVDAPITLNLKNVPAEMLLDLVLRQAGLDYRLRSGVIMVASQQTIQSQVEVRVYPVREEDAQELAALIPATIATDNWREPVQTQPMYGAMGGAGMGGGGDPFGGGGGPGTIRVFRGVLVISQTPEVHERIRNLIDALDSVLADRPRRSASGMMGSAGGDMAGGEGAGYGAGGYGAAGYGRSPAYGRGAEGGYGSGDAGGGYGASRGRQARPSPGTPTDGSTAPSTPGLPSGVPGGVGPGPTPPSTNPAGLPPGAGSDPLPASGRGSASGANPDTPRAGSGAPRATPETPRTGPTAPSTGDPSFGPPAPQSPPRDPGIVPGAPDAPSSPRSAGAPPSSDPGRASN
jgi:hypothetical protein